MKNHPLRATVSTLQVDLDTPARESVLICIAFARIGKEGLNWQSSLAWSPKKID